MGGTVEHGGSAGGRDRGAAGRQQGPQSLLPPSAPQDGPQDKVPRRWRRWVGAWRRWSLWTLLVALVAGMLVTQVWLAGRYEASQVQSRLERDTADAVADIRNAFAHNLQNLQALQAGDPDLAIWESRAGDLLTQRRELYVANINEPASAQQESLVKKVEARARQEGVGCVRVLGRLEAELNDLSDDDRGVFMKDLGLSDPTTARVIHAGYQLLGLITFYTTEGNILQAWPLKSGRLAPEAAGQIHSDMQKGFISADVISTADLLKTGTMAAARAQGRLRQEGKHYEVRDGDVFRFHFA